MIQSFNADTKSPLTTYNQSAEALTFLDDHTFGSFGSSNVFFVWHDEGTSEPIQTIDLENDNSCRAVMVMSPTMFLISNKHFSSSQKYYSLI